MLTLWLVSGFYSLFGQQALRMLQFPFVRKKVKQFLISGLLMIRHLGNDILQVIPWVHIVCLAGGQQGTDYRHVNGSLVIAAEEIVLAPQSSKHSKKYTSTRRYMHVRPDWSLDKYFCSKKLGLGSI